MYYNRSVTVDIDIDDIISEIRTVDLKAELESRSDYEPSIDNVDLDLVSYIESDTGRIVQSFDDDEIVDWFLRKLGRRVGPYYKNNKQ